MNRSDLVLKHLQRYGSIKYERVRALAGSRNVPDVIFKLRKRGHGIETVNKTSAKGVRYTSGYTYHSKAAA